MTKLRGRPKAVEQAASDARSMEMLEAYLGGGVTHDDLCERYGITSRAVRLRLAKARSVKFGGHVGLI